MAQQDRAGARRPRRLGSVVRIVAALALSVLSLPLVSTPASALTASDVLGWIDGAPPGSPSFTDGTGKTDDIFQASKESDAPTSWQGFSGGVDQGSDVTAVYTTNTIDVTTGDLWFYLGYARATTGVATGIVELNQQADVSGAGGGILVPSRGAGDLRISFTQSTGGSPFSEYAVQRWTGSTWGPAVTLPVSSYRSATSTDGLFAEFAIDLSATGLAPSCGSSFTQVNMRTRSSDLETAELKDYVAPLSVAVQARCRSITVQKYDEHNHPVSGAHFQLYTDTNGNQTLDAADPKVGAAVVADQNGNGYTWSDLPWGDYLVQETAPPTGYGADTSDVQHVTLDASTPGGVATVSFHDPEIGAAIAVQKFDATTRQALPGATFQLWQDDGDGSFDTADAAQGPAQVADSGPGGNSHTWSGLDYGTYFVQETAAPAGYQLDPTAVQKVTLSPADAGSTKTVSFDDAPLTPTIVVTKHDADGNPVTGAGFTLFADTNADGHLDTGDQPVGTQVIADQGPAKNSYTWESGLDWGTYFVKETSTPAGYGTDPTATGGVKKVDLPNSTPGGTASVDFTDPRLTASITVRKFDFDTRQALAGATFGLYTDDNADGRFDAGDTEAAPARAADDGPGHNTATWTGLAWGRDYLVVETIPPAGYDTDLSAVNGAKLVSLTRGDAGGTATVDFFDPKTPAAQNPGTITVFKTDAFDGSPVDGAMFTLYLDGNHDGKAETGEQRYSDPPRIAKGTYQWQVEPGDYLVEEASPPAGYTLPADPVQAVTVGDGQNRTTTFADQQKLSTIVVTKTDAGTGAALAGATFTLTDEHGTDLGAPTTSGAGTYTWTGLRMGDYTVTETAPPPGYTLPATARQTVDLDGDDAGSTARLSFADTQKTSTIEVHKYDASTLAPLDGATFTLTDEHGTDLGAPTTSGTGTYTWTGLPMGSYTVTETAPPAGYLPPDQDTLPAGPTMNALFDASTAGGTAVLDFYDQRRPTPPAPGASGTDLVVTKRDEVSGDPLDTATFQLYRDDGDGTLGSADAAQGAPAQTVDGQVRWDGLPAGTYFVAETVAPQGYRVTAPLTVVIAAADAGTTIRRDVSDPRLPTTLQVLKVDDLSHQPLAGATFQAYADTDGNGRVDSADRPVDGPQVTDAHGLTDWPGLGYGSYLVREVAPPPGYDMPATADQRVVIDRSNAGGVLQVLFLDPAQSGFSVTKQAFERTAAGWVPSDGTVAFGAPVRYVVTARPLGTHEADAVTVSDYVPGSAAVPGSAGQASYVAGSARCLGGSCRTSYDEATGLVRWRLGDLRPGTVRKAAFVVRMPQLPAHPTYLHGRYTEKVVNVAAVSWLQPAAPTARTSGPVARSTRSNTVRTLVQDGPEVLGKPPATRAHPGTGAPPAGGAGLPNTGAPAHLGTLGLIGWLSALCGGWLMLRRPRRQHPVQP